MELSELTIAGSDSPGVVSSIFAEDGVFDEIVLDCEVGEFDGELFVVGHVG